MAEQNKVRRANYIVVTGWMVKDLHLKGTELLVYAIVYGFSQDGESTFDGSAEYFAEWTNTSRRNVMECLASLTRKGFLEKIENYKNGVKYVSYKVSKKSITTSDFIPCEETSYPCEETSHPYEETSHNILVNNLDNNLNVKEINKEKDDGIPYQDIIEHLNMRVGARYSSKSRETRNHIHARFAEGYTLDDFMTVIDKKTDQWINDEKMSKYLRPKTLFGKNFDTYLNEPVSRGGKQDMSSFINEMNDWAERQQNSAEGVFEF